jgi:serine/threonine-protein kinase RsbW
MVEASVLRLEAILENVPRAIDFVTGQAQAAGFEKQALSEIQIAVDEACANIVHHAYGETEAGDLEVVCSIEGQCFVVRVRDWGKSFAPDEIDDPDVDAPLEERTLGGLGLFLIRQFMEQVEFDFDPELGNELIMSKRLPVAE